MKHVKKSVLLWYSPREMYELVVGVERYPEFLPWCERAEILQRQAETVISADGGPAESITARLGLAYAGVRHAFTTRNSHSLNRRVDMHLVDGPFSVLEGVWQFVPLSKPGSPAAVEREGEAEQAQACKIEFELRYAFSSLALEAVVSPVFDRVANTLVERFVQRAEAVYGAR